MEERAIRRNRSFYLVRSLLRADLGAPKHHRLLCCLRGHALYRIIHHALAFGQEPPSDQAADRGRGSLQLSSGRFDGAHGLNTNVGLYENLCQKLDASSTKVNSIEDADTCADDHPSSFDSRT